MGMADPRAQWPCSSAGKDFCKLAFRCISMTEEHRPGFADIVKVLRGLRDAPEPQALSHTPTNAGTLSSQGPRYHERGMVFGPTGAPIASIQPSMGGQAQPMPLGYQAVCLPAGGVPVLSPSTQLQQSLPPQDVTPKRHLLQHQATIATTANGYQPAAIQEASWCVSQSFRVCGEGEEPWFIDQVRLLDRQAFTSVNVAVEHLNLGVASCPEGVCLVFSASSHAFCLLYRMELKDYAYAKFKRVEENAVHSSSNANVQEPVQAIYDAAPLEQHKVDVSAGTTADRRRDEHSEDAAHTSRAQAAPTDVGSAAPEGNAACEPACLGTSFVGVEMTPLFVLEVGGPAVRHGAAPELRRIVHGVPTHTDEASLCPSLLLGRAQQSGFWQRLLSDEAYNSLSRQHLQIEVRGDVLEGSDDVQFCVRNLSDLNPIRVCARVEDGFDAYPPLAKGELRDISHGDTIVANPSKDHMLWLVFEHLSSSKLELSEMGEALPRAYAGGSAVQQDRRPTKSFDRVTTF